MFQRTKKFLKKSIQTFKSYFSEGYEKLPKSSSYNEHHNVGGYNLETVYSEFVDQHEATNRIMAISYEKSNHNLKQNKPSMLMNKDEVIRRHQTKHEEKSLREREEKRCLVTKRLKELEILDKNNGDNVLDIQEVLYCYSMLTCPVYCEIVEKFFMEMYSEVSSLLHSDNSTTRRIFPV